MGRFLFWMFTGQFHVRLDMMLHVGKSDFWVGSRAVVFLFHSINSKVPRTAILNCPSGILKWLLPGTTGCSGRKCDTARKGLATLRLLVPKANTIKANWSGFDSRSAILGFGRWPSGVGGCVFWSFAFGFRKGTQKETEEKPKGNRRETKRKQRRHQRETKEKPKETKEKLQGSQREAFFVDHAEAPFFSSWVHQLKRKEFSQRLLLLFGGDEVCVLFK